MFLLPQKISFLKYDPRYITTCKQMQNPTIRILESHKVFSYSYKNLRLLTNTQDDTSKQLVPSELEV